MAKTLALLSQHIILIARKRTQPNTDPMQHRKTISLTAKDDAAYAREEFTSYAEPGQLAVEAKAQLSRRRDRQVYHAHEVPDDILAALEASEPPAESNAAECELANKGR